MKKFSDFLKEEFKDKNFEDAFYNELEVERVAVEIAFYREKAGLTQQELADKIGTSQSAIARLEDSKYKGYSIKQLRKIADAFDLELVVTYREKGASFSSVVVPTIYHVESTVWENKENGYNFLRSTSANEEKVG